MKKIFIVAEFEFMQTAKRWQFLAVTIFLPLFVLFLFYISYESGIFAEKDLEKRFKKGDQILIHDSSDFFKLENQEGFLIVDSVDDHKEALLSGNAICFINIPADYFKTGRLELIAPKNRLLGSSRSIKTPVEKLLRTRLLAPVKDKSQQERIFKTADFTLFSLETSGEVKKLDFHELVVPFFFLIIFILSLSTASTFLLQSVSEEKEHRTVEILLSTVSDSTLIAGKALGLGSAALLQVATWTAMGLISLKWIAHFLKVELSVSQIPVSHFLYASATLLIGFLLFSALMIGIGALGSNFKDAQQLSSFFMIASFLPIYVLQIILTDIHGTLSVGLFYFPLTAPIVMTTRFCVGNLPWYESLSGLLVLAFFAFITIHLAARSFRLGCLLFNRRPTMKELKSAFFKSS
jgi:ABC-2 type transport system permease protein